MMRAMLNEAAQSMLMHSKKWSFFWKERAEPAVGLRSTSGRYDVTGTGHRLAAGVVLLLDGGNPIS
jgi:hypothetical protein